jgi:hypothetical protein
MDWVGDQMNAYPSLSASQWMAFHRETLFRHDDNDRLFTINEPGFPEPPRFWMGRTVHGNQ